MPMHMYTIRAGSRGRRLLVYARQADGGPAIGIDLTAVGAAYVRDESIAAVEFDAGATEVDPDLVGGVYSIAIPDAALEPGATRAMIVLRHEAAIFDPIDIDLVMYDPQDSVRLGMTALGPEQRIDALRGAFPRLSALELKERAALSEDSP